ncbi:MAG: hypothetical protein FWC45_01410, partial [Treponema sp.]|nr:hypothetical protein [Treponema sp.]
MNCRFTVMRKCFFRMAVISAVLVLLTASPAELFSQTAPGPGDSFPPGLNRRILDYQFERADRELSPSRWMEEARRGISGVQAVWTEIAPEIFMNPESLAELNEWTEQELEKRFTRWLLERFFGAGIEERSASVFTETGAADKSLIYYTGPDGSILLDPETGDPRIIRPGDEGHEFAADLSAWKQQVRDASDREVQNYASGIMEKYPELLEYISPERKEEFEQKLAGAGGNAVLSLKREFEAVLAREERYFTAQRLGDVWSLRKKSEDQSAAAIGDKLIEEARLVCDAGIAAIEARIEAAKIEGGDLELAGAGWLEEYRAQFERGMEAWQSAEERFLVRRLEWEQSAEKTFYEGMETWNAVFVRFEEERRNWEDKARILFSEGEEFFARASETLEAAIAAAKDEYARDSALRTNAASDRAGALSSMYVLSSSAADEAGKNIEFWTKKYLELQPGAAVPQASDLESWTAQELQRLGSKAGALEGLILDELKNWSGLYLNYTARAEESRKLLMQELYALGVSSDISEAGTVFTADYYQTELLRAQGELGYWENRSALAEAVAAYAAALDAGRVTAAEGFEAWEKAKAAYDESAVLYGAAEDSLQQGGAALSAARDTLVEAAEKMKAADAALEKLRQNYDALAAALG